MILRKVGMGLLLEELGIDAKEKNEEIKREKFKGKNNNHSGISGNNNGSNVTIYNQLYLCPKC